ncbi:hypothetical protein K4B79_44335 [Streptomyces lincolnensis]|uniref:hypothetical protein n=1 Tax=Streptomyces lincolnensis TaxID=1915 RepID=UPI001E5F32B2|nr:hypothetical protein [Streptomyces lincolnensis]MCD7445204.1 hypothetical protein [Streptomyces lincolnensis]
MRGAPQRAGRTQPFEEAQLLRLDHEAHIKEITLFGRPMPALTAMMITLGPDLTLRQGRRSLTARQRRAAHALVTFRDRSVVPPPRPGARRSR